MSWIGTEYAKPCRICASPEPRPSSTEDSTLVQALLAMNKTSADPTHWRIFVPSHPEEKAN
jgi:hypothetical protein